jgi:hypothetical protein
MSNDGSGLKTSYNDAIATVTCSETSLRANARERDKDSIQEDMPIPLGRQRDKEGPDKRESITGKGSDIAGWLNAECTSETRGSISKSHGASSLRFTCQNGHNFFLSLQNVCELHELLSQKMSISDRYKAIQNCDWCTKCKNFLNKTNEVAVRKEMQVIDGLYGTEITLSCKRNHHFTISYQKKLTYLSCLECQRIDKSEQRQREVEFENEQKELTRQMQERMFAQAKLNMEEQGNHNRNCNCANCATKRAAEELAMLEQSINHRAAFQAKQFMRDTHQIATFEQCFLAYKFTQTAVAVIATGMQNLCTM